MVKRHFAFFVCLFLFLLLLAKNPFSTRTLIPNLEPYPDTIHYINPALSFIQGNGLQIWREGRGLTTTVPPLYSIFLIPFFLIKQDARMFYFTNVILALLSYFFFYKVINRLTYEVRRQSGNLTSAVKEDKGRGTAQVLSSFTLFLYVTNYFIYWYPSLAMAENLTLFLFMAGIYLLILPVTRKNIVLAGLITVAFYATKYASISLAGTYFLSYLIKILTFSKSRSYSKFTSALILISISVITFLTYSFWEWQTKGTTLLMTLYGVFIPQQTPSVLSSDGWFSTAYVEKNLPQFLRAIVGGYPAPFLWDQTPIVTKMVGTLGLTGLILGSISKKTRFLSLSLSFILLSAILFMSTFYSFDMRYLNFAIPTLLIGFVMFWMFIWEKLKSFKSSGLIMNAVLIIFFIFYLVTNAVRIKSQISINLRYAETPWYYLSVVKMNEYFGSLPKSVKKPIVISSIIPYYIDFYSNKTYNLLPLYKHQEFRNHMQAAWGKHDYTDLMKIYKSYLDKGYDVYIDNYGLGNEKVLQDQHALIHKTFKTELVSGGCLGACNIWKLFADR